MLHKLLWFESLTNMSSQPTSQCYIDFIVSKVKTWLDLCYMAHFTDVTSLLSIFKDVLHKIIMSQLFYYFILLCEFLKLDTPKTQVHFFFITILIHATQNKFCIFYLIKSTKQWHLFFVILHINNITSWLACLFKTTSTL